MPKRVGFTEPVFYVSADIRCEECDGTGFVNGPGWIDYLTQKAKGGYQTPDEYAAAAGYSEGIEEEVYCHECDGKGYITEQIRLTDALEYLSAK